MKQISASSGFTLVEVVLSVVILGLMVAGISALYFSGFQSLNTEEERMLLDSELRSQMERVMGMPVASITDDSKVVTVKGQTYTVSWTVTKIDLNGDATSEPNATQVTVSLAGVPGASLTTILVDHEGRLGKI